MYQLLFHGLLHYSVIKFSVSLLKTEKMEIFLSFSTDSCLTRNPFGYISNIFHVSGEQGTGQSALSKLANRFRRRKEIENSEKNKASDPRQTHKESDNSQGAEKGGGSSSSSQSLEEKGTGAESLKKSGSKSKE